MADASIFVFLGGTVANVTQKFITDTSSNVINNTLPIVTVVMTGYLILLGYQTMQGKGASFAEFSTRAAKIAIVLAVAKNFNDYNDVIVRGYTNIETLVLSITSRTTEAAGIDNSDGLGIYRRLDGVINSGFEELVRVESTIDGSYVTQGLKYLMVVIIFVIALGAMTLLGAIIMISAKTAIAALLAVGPFFLFLFMFPVTARYTVGWSNQIVTYTIQILLVSLFISFSLEVSGSMFDRMTAASAAGRATNPILSALQLLFVSVVLMWLLKQVSNIASAIGGGAALNPQSLSEVSAGAKKMFNPDSEKSGSNGQAVTSSRLRHIKNGRGAIGKTAHGAGKMAKNLLGKAKGSNQVSLAQKSSEASAPQLTTGGQVPNRLRSRGM